MDGRACVLIVVAACGSSDPQRPDAAASDAAVDAPWTVRQLGTAYADVATSVGIDAAGTIYVAGTTRGALGTTPSAGGADLFIAAIGRDVEWITQLGSAGDDTLEDLAVIGDGVAIAGVTDGALPGQTHHGLQDIVVAGFGTDGAARWITQYGTFGHDRANAIIVHGDELLVAGTSDEHDTGDYDIRIDTVAATGELGPSYPIRTPDPERAEGLALDGRGGVIVVGGALGPLGGEWRGSFDPFVLDVRTLGERATWGSQHGTIDIDAALDVAVDGAGNVYVLAMSYSDLVDRKFENDGRAGVFVMKYTAESGQLVWIRRIGLADAETVTNKLALDARGYAYVAGGTRGAIGSPNAGGLDAFVAVLDGDGTIVQTMQLGTAADDLALDVVVSGDEVIVVGATGGALAGPGTHAGDADAFIARLPLDRTR